MKLWIKRNMTWDKALGSVLCLAGMGMLGVSVYLSFSSDIWYDELFTMGLANRSCGKLISITARDVHPPLYYMIVRLFLWLFGGLKGDIACQTAVAKLASVLPFFLCMLYALTKVRKNFGMLAAGIFCFLLPSMPKLADYTVEIRMYGYGLFFVTAGMLHAYELVRGTRDASKRFSMRADWTAFTLYALAACYTHYFACAAFAMIYLYLLFSFFREKRGKEIRMLMGSGFLCAAGYLPWIICAFTIQLGQVKENYWIQPLTWRSLGGCIKYVFEFAFSSRLLSMAAGALLFAFYGEMLVLCLFRTKNKEQQEEGTESKKKRERETGFIFGCIGVPVGVVLFGFLASVLIRPVFVYRYMLPALGTFWLAFAVLLAREKEKKYFFIPAALFLIVAGIINYRSFYGEEMWKRVQMKEARQALSQIDENDVIIYNFDQAQAVISYYLDNDTYLWYGKPEALIQEMYPQNSALVEGEFSDEAGIAVLQELLLEREYSGKIYFFGSGNARDEIIEKWGNAGIKVTQTASAMIERYWFNIYECKLQSFE